VTKKPTFHFFSPTGQTRFRKNETKTKQLLDKKKRSVVTNSPNLLFPTHHQQQVHNFILEVADRYLPNHYHNLWHAADVCFTTWRFLHESECVEWMTPVEVLAALLAAYGHDVGHPGVNNAFLVATSSDLALLHNDHSPLENMHSTLLAAVLRDTAVLEPLTLNEAREARAIMISAILGTDMMHHFSQISDLRVKKKKHTQGGVGVNRSG
jgi:hypothetical protein